MIDENGWTATEGPTEPDEIHEMEDVDLVADLTHPVRGVLLRHLKQPRTVAELAEALDVPITRLYHHVNRLDGLGLIRVVATRRVGAVTERRYQVTARSWRLAESVFATLDPRELAQALGSLFDVAKLGLQREIEQGMFDDIAAAQHRFALSLGELRLSEERRAELLRRIEALVAEFSSDSDESDPDSAVTTLFVAAYPES